MQNETPETNDNISRTEEFSDSLLENNHHQHSIDDDFEHEEIIDETKWDDSSDFLNINRVIDLPSSTNAFIVKSKGANVSMQEAFYLPVSPDNSQCWEIERDDKFLIDDTDETSSFDIYSSDFSAPNVLRVSVIQKTPQLRGAKCSKSNTVDTMKPSDPENLTESIWNDYTISQLPSLENNLHHVIAEDLMDTDNVDEQLLQNVENEAAVALFQPANMTIDDDEDDDDDILMVTCRCCNKNFSFYDLKLHIAEKSTEGYYTCDQCSEIFLLKEDLNSHVLTHLSSEDNNSSNSNTSTYECEHCGATLPNEAALVLHKKIHIPFRCSYCMEDFTDVVDLDAHMNDRHATKRVKTDVQENKNVVMQNEKEIVKQIDAPAKSDAEKLEPDTPMVPNASPKAAEAAAADNKIHIQCPKCKEKFSFAAESEIVSYIKTHTPTTYYKCGFCDTIVTNKNEFNEHMKNHTTLVESNSGNKFPYKCSYCDNLAFETIEELTSHIQMHVPRSIFVCPKCSAQFVRQNKRLETVTIRQHIRKETISKLTTTPVLAPADKMPVKENLKCKTCLAVFKKQDDFNKHVKTHLMPDTKEEVSDVKVDPSFCAYCSSELSSIAEIIVHIRKHTEERKLFPCSNCDKKAAVDRNQNSNNRGKENLCNYCLSKMGGNFKVYG